MIIQIFSFTTPPSFSIIFNFKYLKSNSISIFEKKKMTNDIINLHFLTFFFRLEYYEEYFYKKNDLHFFVKDFFIENKLNQTYNSIYFKYCKKYYYFQLLFFNKTNLINPYFSNQKFSPPFFFKKSFFLSLKTFNKKIIKCYLKKKNLKLFENLAKKNIKKEFKLIKGLKIKKFKKKKLFFEINQKIILLRNVNCIIKTNFFDERFIEIYFYIKTKIKKDLDIKYRTKNINKNFYIIYSFYKNIKNLFSLNQKKQLIELYKKNEWSDLKKNEKLSLITIKTKDFFYLKIKEKAYSSFYSKVCKEIDPIDLYVDREKKKINYLDFFEKNKIDTFINSAIKHTDSDIFSKKEIDYILYLTFNFLRSTMIFKTEKKKKIFLAPTINYIIKQELKKDILNSKSVIIEFNKNFIILNIYSKKNLKNLTIDNLLLIENNINFFFNEEVCTKSFKNDLKNLFYVSDKMINKKQNDFLLSKVDNFYIIKKKNLFADNFAFNNNVKTLFFKLIYKNNM